MWLIQPQGRGQGQDPGLFLCDYLGLMVTRWLLSSRHHPHGDKMAARASGSVSSLNQIPKWEGRGCVCGERVISSWASPLLSGRKRSFPEVPCRHCLIYHWSYGLWESKEVAFLASMMGGRWGSNGLGMDGGELTFNVC